MHVGASSDVALVFLSPVPGLWSRIHYVSKNHVNDYMYAEIFE